MKQERWVIVVAAAAIIVMCLCAALAMFVIVPAGLFGVAVP